MLVLAHVMVIAHKICPFLMISPLSLLWFWGWIWWWYKWHVVVSSHWLTAEGMLPKVKVLKFGPREPPKRIERIWSEKCTSFQKNSLNHSEAAPPPRIEDKHLRLSFPQSRDRVSLETFVLDWPSIKEVAQFFSSIWEFFARLFLDEIMSVSVAGGSNNSNSSGVDRSRAAVVALNPLLAVANQTTGSCCFKWGIVFLFKRN